MAARVVRKVCFSGVLLRTSFTSRAIHVTRRQQYARRPSVRQRPLFPRNVGGIGDLNVPPQPVAALPKQSDISEFVQPLNDDDKFK